MELIEPTLIGTKVGKITGFTEENARFVEFFLIVLNLRPTFVS